MAGTWGDIRAELAEEFENISFDLLDSKIRSAYEDILGERDWSWLKGTDRVRCEASYNAGLISLTAGSSAVTGIGTAWTSDFSTREIQIVSRGELYQFTFISATSGTLDRPFEGSTGAEYSYTLFRRTYPLSVRVKGLERVTNPRTNKNVKELTRTELLPGLVVFGEPEYYAMAPSGGSDPVYKQVTFQPCPDLAMSIDIDYQKAVPNFTGENTSSSPLPEVYTAAIVDLAAAKLFSTKQYKDPQLAAARTAQGKTTLDRMHREENQRIPASKVDVDTHYTDHELKRATW